MGGMIFVYFAVQKVNKYLKPCEGEQINDANEQYNKLQATLDSYNPKLCPLTYSLTHRGKV